MDASATQNHLIIARLQATPGQWVPMPELADCSGSYNIHTRIDEIRRTTVHRVENRLERAPGSTRKLSFYRIISPNDQ